MHLPGKVEYREAIQNPHLCFDDPELRAGKPEEDSIALPRPFSGNFAIVFHMRCGQHDFAVKCFTRDIPDQQQRYAQISQHLAHERLPFTIGFDFLERGIKVQGQWYPILKMGWISGDTLDTYIKKHLNDPSRLLELAKCWLVLMTRLKEASIAHGDLQHGNVLVVNGDLKIIDYDGMFVPSLQGKMSHELGHPNYQHPQRTATDFGPELDHFSAWSIYTSLVALGADPSLWSTIPGAGDDCLLFRKDDFAAPQSSSTLSRLTSHSDPRIQVLSSLFESMVYLNPLQVPSLDGNTPQTPVPSPLTGSSVPAWLNDHVSLSQGSTASIQSQVEIKANSELPAGSAGWVLDFIDPPQVAATRSFESSFAIPRVMAIVAILAIPGLSAVALPVHVACVMGLLLVEEIVLLVNYSRTPVVIEKRAVLTLQKKELSELSSVKKAMRENEKFRNKLQAEEHDKRNKLFTQKSQWQKQESNEQDQVQSRLRSAIDAINRRRQTIGQDEAAALARVQADIGNKLSNIDKHIGTIDRAQQDEISEGMNTMQRQFLTNYLQSYRIQDATIPGIGEALKHSLRHYGFVTAADVDQYSVQQVPGIGATKAAAIETWRQRRVNEAFSQMPSALPAQEIDRIVTKYKQQRQLLVSQRQAEQVRLNTDIDAIRNHYVSMRPPLDAEQAVAQDTANRDRQGIVDRYAQDYARLSQQMSLLAKDYVEKYATLDEEAACVRKQLLQHNWDLAKIQRELSTFANISFRRYLWAACADYRGKA